jgi:hypothetical protein
MALLVVERDRTKREQVGKLWREGNKGNKEKRKGGENNEYEDKEKKNNSKQLHFHLQLLRFHILYGRTTTWVCSKQFPISDDSLRLRGTQPSQSSV